MWNISPAHSPRRSNEFTGGAPPERNVSDGFEPKQEN
jgi:hypothetical protein